MKKLIGIVLIVKFSMPLLLMASGLSEQASELSNEFQIAHSSQNYPKIKKLIYFKGVEQKTIDSTARLIRRDFGKKIKKCFVTVLPAGQRTEYRLENKLYRANLTPVGVLRVEFEPTDTSASQQHIASTYLVGMKDGKYLITLAAPIAK